MKHPIRELGKLVHDMDPNIYFVVDGVSIIGAVDVDMERDNIDLLVGVVKSYHATSRCCFCSL